MYSYWARRERTELKLGLKRLVVGSLDADKLGQVGAAQHILLRPEILSKGTKIWARLGLNCSYDQQLAREESQWLFTVDHS